MVAWLAQWAAMTINIAREGPDGRTAWENDALVLRSVARPQHLERKCSTCPREECDCRLASGFLLCVSWYSLGARSFLRLPEAELNDPSLLLSPWSSLGPVVLHAQLPPDPVGPAPVPRRVYRACSSAASQHRQGRVVPMLKLVGHGSKLRCVQTRTWSLARQKRSYHVLASGSACGRDDEEEEEEEEERLIR